MPNGEAYTKLIVNMPPRHLKTRTIILAIQWILGVDCTKKIIATCYNDRVATDLSRYTRDGIVQKSIDSYGIVYSDIFPNSKIKQGDSSVERWALEGQFFNYMGAGIGGSITGKGADIFIYDDLIKNALEALTLVCLNKNGNGS